MDSFFNLLTEPLVLVGILCGVAVAVVFHWLAPAGTDTVSAGALFVLLGAIGGLIWSWVSENGEKS